ncbi:MAG: hypothetical protein ACJARX_002550, partial [Psychroserpens sp.]
MVTVSIINEMSSVFDCAKADSDNVMLSMIRSVLCLVWLVFIDFDLSSESFHNRKL